jgi:hypothetical protein
VQYRRGTLVVAPEGRLASEPLEQSLAAQASAARCVAVVSLAVDLAVVQRPQEQELSHPPWAEVVVAKALAQQAHLAGGLGVMP